MNNTHTLPAEYYVSDSYFAKEMQALFFNQWVCAGRLEQINQPGKYFLREIQKESVILTLDENSKPRAFYNVCRHRGTRMCDKESGHFKGRISCPYHAWTYNLAGELVGAPHMNETTGFSMKDYPLNEIQTDTWDGHLWINLSKSPTPLKEQLGNLTSNFQNWNAEELQLGKRIIYSIKANWKFIIQNYSECLHCPVIHPSLKVLSSYMSGDNEPVSKRYLGGCMTLNDGVTTMTRDGKTSRKTLKNLDEKQKRHVYYYWVNPNILLSFHPDYLMTHTLWPKRPDLTEVICEWHFHPSEFSDKNFSANDAVEFWDEVNREDWHVSELSQLGISSRSYVPGPFSNREGLLAGLDRTLLEQVRN